MALLTCSLIFCVILPNMVLDFLSVCTMRIALGFPTPWVVFTLLIATISNPFDMCPASITLGLAIVTNTIVFSFDHRTSFIIAGFIWLLALLAARIIKPRDN